ncbi:histidine kinase [Niastella yeongjuensis]|uniref:histidine kinase n=1 Tax=Niastella yeongjuensis TaxID=354355 RepID=A0A1V9EEJ9_9BACT|nr:response regulator [Niastella yeongjuensis]OQP44550.1 histidine kinase [Niastella yeongjuensis]SEO83810.1 Signal transduction histidine kinase [Niastella yeongjuensis]
MNAFKRNLIIGYGISLLLLIISAVASYLSINNLLNSAQWVNHTNAVGKKVEGVISVLVDAETAQRGYLLTNQEEFLQPFNGSRERANNLLSELKTLTADNYPQQQDGELLRIQANARLSYLNELILKKRKGELIPDSMLLAGKEQMDYAREIVDRMRNREESLLKIRTQSMNRFAASTPTLILVACVLGILVTIISFLRVLNDFQKRTALQLELQEKDEQISRRLELIDEVATTISEGNYGVKVEDKGSDALASIAISLNKMTDALHISFTQLKDQQWLQTGIAQLNEIMIGKKEMELLTFDVIEFVTNYTGSAQGAFYLRTDENLIQLVAGVAISNKAAKANIKFGEGIAGRCAQSGQAVHLENIPETQVTIDYTGGSIKPASILAIPIFYENRLKGVLEITTLQSYRPIMLDFMREAGYNIGLAVHSARDHQRLQELLTETQAQSEELQAQHTELENINAELEAQAERLQTSEEELRVQQEELQHANHELEERSQLLEEKNELIVERNLEIQARAEELAMSTRYKSEFLANMSHELRTPLNSILLLSRLLNENHTNNLTNDQIEYANVIQTSGKGLLTLIDEILDLSKIEAGKMELEYTDVRITDLVNELQALFTPLAEEKGVAFKVEQESELPLTIETDRLRLNQILRNLISNAIKFTKKGSVVLSITQQGTECRFSVKDTGIGISKEKQAIIFEAFQQADGSTRRQFGGTGLGLSISQKLAQLLNGDISLTSAEGEGSEFILELPMTKSAAATKMHSVAVVIHREQTDKTATPVSAGENQYISPVIPSPVEDDRDAMTSGEKLILIIEDDTAFARSLLEYTRAKGYKGIVAVRGDEGIALAKQYMPSGILLDLQLPVMSGWQVMDELKADNSTRHIPVHIMSAYQMKTQSLSKGAVDFINKPVAFEKLGEMFSKIEQALNRHPKKVLIVEENTQHAKALAYFLSNYNVASEIENTVEDGIKSLTQKEIDCVILDMGIPAQRSYDTLDEVKKTRGLEDVPIIVFTGKNLSQSEEIKIKQYADSIVVKTAHSYQRILDEVSLFLHLVEENQQDTRTFRRNRKVETGEVLKGKTVLVVDDDVRNIFSLSKSLESYGMQVVSAIDGKEALKQLEGDVKIDMVLMDMMMPELDGYETTRILRKMPQYRNLPVIAVTAKAMTGDREKCIAAGASDYITKPVDVDQLISLLRVWLYQ